ncbi:hypothetical protein KKF70_00365 [bacterium]|nr:hypothetical protein [Candidatus Omnitrophota bacterium]MBU2527826.1 hypothetical protein [bacterium]MBU3930741.1 hypothetical protein [bacterium]MBU4122897.1 hypothetical protein [bacterium]
MDLLLPIKISAALSVIFFILPDKRKLVVPAALTAAISLFIISIYSLFFRDIALASRPYIMADNISKAVYFLISFFGAIMAIYSSGFITRKLNRYFAYFFLTIASSLGVVISANWLIFTIFWGISGTALFLMIQLESGANAAAKKTMIILGGSDSLLILGIAIIYYATGTFTIGTAPWSGLAATCLLAAALAKAGGMPLHTWIPGCAETAPLPVTAFIPAALDKILGIYMMTRLFQIMRFPPEARMAVMIIGAGTIICAVFMALKQHNAKKLLSYHAISQVGYMILGIASGTTLGLIGGFFHMVNHAIYKCALFLGTGQVEKTTGTDHLEKLGGLAKLLPFTFTSMLIASFAISGIPPFNGFYSKWLIYQGILGANTKDFQLLTMLCLLAALFGSGLTLASFMKLIHAIFLGSSSPLIGRIEPSHREKFSLVFPQITLAAACILLGLFAVNIFIKPVFGSGVLDEIRGAWSPGTASLLMIAGIVIGILLYWLSGSKTRRAGSFIGGYKVAPEMRVSGVTFYASIENIFPFRQIFRLADKKVFDLYEMTKLGLFYIIGILRYFHTGVLSNYLTWIFAGGIIIFLAL